MMMMMMMKTPLNVIVGIHGMFNIQQQHNDFSMKKGI